MRSVRSGFWVALALALLVTAHAYWDFFESRRLRTRLEAVAASGAPTRLATTTRLTGASADADRFYRAASVLAGGFHSSASPQADYQLQQALRNGQWTPELTAVLRARLEEQRDALALVDRAAPLPFDGFQLGWRPNYGVGAYVALSRLCEMRAVERAMAGDGDGAFDSLYSDVRLERVMDRPPRFAGIEFVVEHAKPSPAARARLSAALAEIDRDDRLQRTFARMRANVLESSSPSLRRGVTAPLLNHMFTSQLDTFADLIAAASRPPAERASAVVAVGRWPAGFQSREQTRATLEGFIKSTQSEMERIRCARRLISGEMVNCSAK